MLLEHENCLELLLTIRTFFLFPGVGPGSVSAETRLVDKSQITEITLEVLLVLQPEVGGEVGEHVDLHAGPAEPPAAGTSLHRNNLIGRI